MYRVNPLSLSLSLSLWVYPKYIYTHESRGPLKTSTDPAATMCTRAAGSPSQKIGSSLPKGCRCSLGLRVRISAAERQSIRVRVNVFYRVHPDSG